MRARCWTATPAALTAKRGAATLEEAFIGYLVEASGEAAPQPMPRRRALPLAGRPAARRRAARPPASLQRLWSYLWRESLELQRDPVRATLALVGSLVLMFVIGFGISMDVEDLRFAVLDRDQSTLSQSYTQTCGLALLHRAAAMPPTRTWTGACAAASSLAIEIPPGFGRDVLRGSRCRGRLVRRRHAPARRDRQRLCAGHAPALAGAAGARAHGASWAARSASKRAFATTPM
jgi:ribosome-dependent ATPase